MPQAIGVALLKVGFFVFEAFAGAAAAATLGAGAAVAIGAAVVVGGTLVAKRMMSLFEVEIPTVDSDASRQRTVRSTIEPQKIVYGEALVSGPISFIGLAGTDNSDLYQTIVLAGHEVTDITNIHMDDVVITDAQINGGSTAGGNVTGGTFGPKDSTTICVINKYRGLTSQTADSLLTNAFTNYTSAHRGDGIAYLSMKWVLNDDSAETWDKFAPSNVKALVKGKPVYDPRLDTGAPNYNPLNQLFITYNATAGSYVGQGQNPALVLADYLISDLGMGISPSKIEWSSFITAANGCDVSVNVPNSQTEKRFTCNGVLFATDSHQKNINKILSSMNGNLVYSNGKYIVHAGIYEDETVANPFGTLNEDDLIGAISVRTSLERSDRFNTIKGLFVDPLQNHKSSEFPKVQLADAVERDNDEILEKEVQYPMTNSSYMAQRLSFKLIKLSDQQKIISFPANLSALRITAGDRVKVSIEELSWSDKIFQCVGWNFSEEGGVNLTLREDSSSAYDDPVPNANPALSQYSTITATGDITDAFRGVPSPSGLRAASGEKKVFLNWVNPGKPSDFGTVEVYASASNNVANAVKIGETDGTQFVHDGNNAADQIAVNDTRVYWVRSKKNVGTVEENAVSVYQPNSTTGVGPVTVLATLVDWDNVADPTIGIDLNNDDTISINLGSSTGTSGKDVAQSGISEDVTITQGGIRMNQGGSIRGGQTSYNNGEGFFLGYDSNKYKLSIRNSTSEALTFDGDDLSVTGAITATSGSIANSVTVGGTAASTVASDAAAGNQAADQISLLPRADDSEWTVGDWNSNAGIWSENGTDENAIVLEAGPHGDVVKIWKATSTDASGPDGGFYNGASNAFPIVSDTVYRFSLFVKQDNTNGVIYFGASNWQSDNTNVNLYHYNGGSGTTNRYWWSGDLPTQGEWYLLVGIINPSDTNINSGKGGIYKVSTGTKESTFVDLRFGGAGSEAVATKFGVRTYQYYAAATPTAIARWAQPRVDRMDRRAPSIAELLRGWTSLAEPINAGVTITGGGITMSGGGSIKGGQSAYNSGTGFFLGHDTNAYKFSIGNAGNNSLTFDGSNLAISGAITATSGTFTGTVNASAGVFTGDVSVGTGAIYGGTMADFNDGSGFFLGYDTDAYKLSVGDSSGEVLTWDGSKLNVEANTVSFATGGEQDYSSESRYTTSQKSATVVLANNSSYFLFDNRRQDLAFPDFIVSYYLGPLTSGTQSSQANARNGIMDSIKVELFYADASTGSPVTWVSFRSVTAGSWYTNSGLGAMFSNFRVKDSGTYVASLDTRNGILDDYPTISPFGDDLDGTSVPVGLVDNDYFINVPISKNTFVFPKGRYFIKAVITVTDGSLSPYPSTGSPTATERRVSIPNASSFVHPDFGQSVFVGGAHTTVFTDNNRDNETLIKGGSVYLMSKEGANADDSDSTAIFFGGRGTTGGTPNSAYGPLHGLYFFNDRDSIGSGSGILGSIGSPQFSMYVPYDGSKLTFGGDANFTDGLYINGVAVNAGAVTGPAGSDTQIQYNNGGSLGASASLTFNDTSNTLTVANLTVSGTTTTVNTDNLTVKDNNITLNYATGDSSSTADDAGITIQDAVDASTDASILWKTATDTFEFSHAISTKNATFDNGSNTTVDVIADDDGMAQIRLYGAAQGTGRLFVGQSTNYGGGIEYNGDNSPVTSGAGADYTALYRITGSTGQAGTFWTARNFVNSNDWEFRGAITWASGSSTNANTAYTYSQVGHLPLAGGTLTGAVSWPSGSSTNANTAYSRVNSTRIGLTAHSLVNFTAVGDYSKPAGYQTMMRGTATESTVVGTPKAASYWLYNVMAKRDTLGGTAALLMNYTGEDFYYGFTSVNTAAPTWRRVWDDNNFSQTDVTNWGTAYTYSQVGHLPLVGGTLTGALSGTTGTFSGAVSGASFELSGISVIDSSQNINAASISTSAITSTGDITLTSTTTSSPSVKFNSSTATDPAVDMAIKLVGEALHFYEPEDSDKVHFKILDDTGVDAPFGYWVNGTRMADASRNLTVGTIASGIITATGGTLTGALSGTTGNFSGALSSGSMTSGSLTTTSDIRSQGKVLSKNTGLSGQDILFAITDSDTTQSITDKFQGLAGFSKTTDATAPAAGVFDVSGYRSPANLSGLIPFGDEDEIIFECWAKYISGGDTAGNFYVGSTFYNGSQSSFGNTGRYWGAAGNALDADHGTWRHIRGVMNGAHIRAQSNTLNAEYLNLLVLFNYLAGDNTTRYCGFKFYRSKQLVTSLYHTPNSNGQKSFQSSWAAGQTQIIDGSGNLNSAATISIAGVPVIDASRNITVGTISSGSITSTGSIAVSGDGFFNGTKLEGDSKEIIRYSDAWLRINPANEFSSGIYCGTGVLRTDGNFQVGSGGGSFNVSSTGNVTAAGTISSDSITSSGSFTTLGSDPNSYGVLRVTHPKGADLYSRTGAQTGAFKIVLPVSWTSTMMTMTIRIYDYTSGGSFDVNVGGYNYYGGEAWINTSAVIVSDPSTNREITVRFGHDGTKCAIYIGETTSTWIHPQISVINFQAGFSAATSVNWDDGWDIAFVTSFGTITATHHQNELSTQHRLVRVGGITVIDASRNITAGAITSSGSVNATELRVGSLVNNGTISANAVSGKQALTAKVQNNGNSLFQGFNASDALITQITGAGALTHNGTISSGAITSSGSITATNTILNTGSTTVSAILRGGDGNSKNLIFQKTTGSAQQAKISAVGEDLRFTTGTTERMVIGSTGAITTSNYIKVDAGHSTARMQLLYSPASDTDKGTLTSWVSEPGISYSDAGIGANIHISGQYYGRQINSGYGVYARFRKSNGQFEVWNTTGVSGTASGQGTARLILSSAGVLNLPTGSLNVQSQEVISSGRELKNITGLDMTASATANIHLNRSGFITFYGNSSDNHGIGSRSSTGGAVDDIRINSYGAVYINLDSNSNNTSVADFVIGRHGAGVGTISTLLTVSGENGDITATGNITTSGNITAYSDERLKEKIQTLDGKKVLQMRGVSFTKDGEAGSGVIAQELEKIAPELVLDGEYKSVAYGNLVGYLIENAKQQQTEIDELKTLVKLLMEK